MPKMVLIKINALTKLLVHFCFESLHVIKADTFVTTAHQKWPKKKCRRFYASIYWNVLTQYIKLSAAFVQLPTVRLLEGEKLHTPMVHRRGGEKRGVIKKLKKKEL